MQPNTTIRDFEEDIPTRPYPAFYLRPVDVPVKPHVRVVPRRTRPPERENQIATAILVSIALVVATIAVTVCWQVSLAHADPVAAVGSGSGSSAASVGSAIAPAAGSAAAPASPATMTDPTSNPLAYLSEVQALWHQSWSAALTFLLWGLLEVLVYASPKESWLAFLSAGRWKVALASAVSVAAAAVNALAGGGTWIAVLTALVTGIALAINTTPKPATST